MLVVVKERIKRVVKGGDKWRSKRCVKTSREGREREKKIYIRTRIRKHWNAW